MCGITALIGKPCAIELYNSLEQLQNRGYDSAGICVVKDNKLNYQKYASTSMSALEKIKQQLFNLENSNIGIAHTRWATHGPKTDYNAHPHLSYNNKFALVHNGIIENYKPLKDKLINERIEFKSQTDSEVIVNLLAYTYSKALNNIKSSELDNNIINKESLTKKVIKNTIEQLEGTWGIVIINLETPNILYCTRRGSPLLVSTNYEYSVITSEVSGFCGKELNYIILNNNDICSIKYSNKTIITTKDSYEIKYNLTKNHELSPDPFPHWTLKEIYEQSESILRTISFGGRLFDNSVKLGGLESNKDNLKDIENIILLGCGTSYYAAMTSKNYFIDLCDFNTIQIIDGAEFSSTDIPKYGKTAMILLSQSGETKDLHRCIEIGKKNNTFLIGVVNVPDSLISREVDCGCYLNAGREVGVASTKSFTAQVVMLSMISIWFSQLNHINNNLRKDYITSLRHLSDDIRTTINNSSKSAKSIVSQFNTKFSTFILGKGQTAAIANEGALKIKELSYIHAEGYTTSSLKHGPFAILEKDYPVILIGIKNNNYVKIENAYEEIKSRHANIIFITNEVTDKPNSIIVSNNKIYSELLSIIPIQLLGYYLAVSRDINPDMPRNLAKVVTVE